MKKLLVAGALLLAFVTPFAEASQQQKIKGCRLRSTLDEEDVWIVQTVEFVEVPPPKKAVMSAEEAFTNNVVKTVRQGRIFASYRIAGTLKSVAAAAANRMDEIVVNGEPGDAVQVVDRCGNVRFMHLRWG